MAHKLAQFVALIANNDMTVPRNEVCAKNLESWYAGTESSFNALAWCRAQIRAEIANLTRKVEGEAWSPKIAQAVTTLRKVLDTLGEI